MPANYGTRPFQAQVDFFRGKLNLPTAAWTDIWQRQHDVGFVVAGAMKADLLSDLRAAVQKAIEQGTTMAEFRHDFDAIVARHGWSYKGGRNWRTRVIYETNLRTSYQAGRYRQMQAIAHRRPYWQYVHSPFVREPRLQHQAWDGLILRHDDPWWDTHYPPNGWGCRCTVRTLAERDLRQLGKAGPNQAPPIEWQEKQVGVRGPSPRTVRVPNGIDPGWGYAPGARYRELLDQAAAKAGAQPYELGRSYLADLVGSDTFSRWLGNPVGNFPLARLPDEQAQQIGATARYAVMSAETARKQIERHPELSASEYMMIQEAVDGGERIIDGRSVIYILTGQGGHVTVIKSTRSGKALFVQSLRRLSRQEAKRDEEIQRLRAKAKK